jgi:hypothetical protein
VWQNKNDLKFAEYTYATSKSKAGKKHNICTERKMQTLARTEEHRSKACVDPEKEEC